MKRYSNSREDLIIELADDLLSATMTIKREGGVIEQDEILSLFHQAGINNGLISSIDQKEVKELHKPFKIAEVEAICDDISFTLYYQDDELYHYDNKLNEANIFKIVYIQKGSPVGKLSFNEDILSRKNIIGEYLFPMEKRRKIISLYQGENLDFDADKNEYFAQVSGYLALSEDGKYSILNHLQLKSDITRDYGNIYIIGNLTIMGDVKDIRHIRVIGTLVIQGNVTNSNIYAENGIEISGNISECNSGGITSPKNIKCANINKSKVFSGQEIHIEGQVKYSRIVGESAIVVGETYEVIASDLYSSRLIRVGNVRSEKNNFSSLEISVSPYTKEQLMILTRELVYFNENDPENEKIPIINKEINQLEEILSRKVEEAIELENSNSLMIETYGKIYPGTKLKILKESQTIEDDTFANKQIINLK